MLSTGKEKPGKTLQCLGASLTVSSPPGGPRRLAWLWGHLPLKDGNIHLLTVLSPAASPATLLASTSASAPAHGQQRSTTTNSTQRGLPAGQFSVVTSVKPGQMFHKVKPGCV